MVRQLALLLNRCLISPSKMRYFPIYRTGIGPVSRTLAIARLCYLPSGSTPGKPPHQRLRGRSHQPSRAAPVAPSTRRRVRSVRRRLVGVKSRHARFVCEKPDSNPNILSNQKRLLLNKGDADHLAWLTPSEPLSHQAGAKGFSNAFLIQSTGFVSLHEERSTSAGVGSRHGSNAGRRARQARDLE